MRHHRKRYLYFLIISALASNFLLVPYLFATEEYYTVQVANLNKIAHAQKQFDFLIQRLKEDDLDYLRIERNDKFYVVRIGRFEDKARAERLLRVIQSVVPGAFIRKDYIKKENIVKLYTKASTKDNDKRTPDHEKNSDLNNKAVVIGIVKEKSLISSTFLGMKEERYLSRLVILVEETEDVKDNPNVLKGKENQAVTFFSEEDQPTELTGKRIKALTEYKGDKRSRLFWIRQIEVIN
ncbi:MAG: SPOR domain-containing protein [Nitrospirota bacterium]